MATTPPVTQVKNAAAEPARLPVVPLLVAVVLGVVVAVSAVGGGFYFLLRSGRLPLQVGAAPAAQVAAPVKTHAVPFEPMLVNLADGSGGAYLRAALTLQVADQAGAKEEKSTEEKGTEKDANAAVRDTVLTVLGHQSSEALLATDGKDRLKKELKAAIAERNPEIRVTDVFFTEFLVQR